MKNITTFTTFTFLILLTACSGAAINNMFDGPGRIVEKKSQTDNSGYIELTPATMKKSAMSNSPIKLGLIKHDNANGIVLRVVYDGVLAFSGGDSLIIKVDDELIKMKSIENKTNFDRKYFDDGTSIPESSKSYRVDKLLLKKMVNSKDCWVKIVMRNGYIEADYNKGGEWAGTAKYGFKEFLERIL